MKTKSFREFQTLAVLSFVYIRYLNMKCITVIERATVEDRIGHCDLIYLFDWCFHVVIKKISLIRRRLGLLLGGNVEIPEPKSNVKS